MNDKLILGIKEIKVKIKMPRETWCLRGAKSEKSWGKDELTGENVGEYFLQ